MHAYMHFANQENIGEVPLGYGHIYDAFYVFGIPKCLMKVFTLYIYIYTYIYICDNGPFVLIIWTLFPFAHVLYISMLFNIY